MFPLNVLPSTRLLVALISSHAPVSGGTEAFGSPPLPVMTLFTTQLLLPMLILNPSSGFPIEMFPMKLFDADDSLMTNPLCLPAGSDGVSMIGRLLFFEVLSWNRSNLVPLLARMPFWLLITRFLTNWLHDPASMSAPSSLFVMQLQNRRPAVEVLKSTPSSECCGWFPSRMFRYLMVTREEPMTLRTSPLLPLGVTKGGGFRATVDVSVPGGGPLSPEHPANDVLAGGSPVITRLKSPLIKTGFPVHLP